MKVDAYGADEMKVDDTPKEGGKGGKGEKEEEDVKVDFSGYVPVYSMLTRPTPLSLDALESVLAHALNVECGRDEDRLRSFYQDCEWPGARASAQGAVATSALRNLANWFVGYRPDGRTVASTSGSGVDFVIQEHWSDQASVDAFSGDDCDGSALTTTAFAFQMGLANFARADSPQIDAKSHPAIHAMRNALFFHVIGLAIVGATTASGTDAKSANTYKVNAGHAIALALPVAHFLRGASRADQIDLSKHVAAASEAERKRQQQLFRSQPIAGDAAKVNAVNSLRARALLPEWRRAQLSAEDRESLGDGRASKLYDFLTQDAVASVSECHPIEGTAMLPTNNLHVSDVRLRTQLHVREKEREKHRAAIGPVIGKVVEDLAHSRSDGRHAFYGHMVEFTVAGALVEDTGLVAAGLAINQFALCPSSQTLREGTPILTGVTPEQLSRGAYNLVDIAGLNAEECRAIVHASRRAERSRMPPVDMSKQQLTPWEDAYLERSLQSLGSIHFDEPDAKDAPAYEPIEFHLTPAMMVHNPECIEQMVAILKESCVDVDVNIMAVDGAIKRASGESGLCIAVVSAWAKLLPSMW